MSTALAPVPATPFALAQQGNLTRDQVDLIKRTIAKGATDDELALFVSTANRLGLDPFARQLFAVKRRTKVDDQWIDVMAIQISIDGYRLTATRTGECDGQEGPFWCGADGAWRDVWLDDKPPSGAKVLVYRKGVSRPFTGIATYASYVQTNRDGKPNAMWSRGPDFMLAKCAEAVALRKAFPNELGGTTTPEEIGDEGEVKTTFAPIVAATGSPPAAMPATTQPASSPAKAAPAPRPLTETEMAELVDQIGKAMTGPALKALGKVIAGLSKTPDQRAELAQAYEEQQDLIEQADREAAAEAQP